MGSCGSGEFIFDQWIWYGIYSHTIKELGLQIANYVNRCKKMFFLFSFSNSSADNGFSVDNVSLQN